jgi:hypothetical protein
VYRRKIMDSETHYRWEHIEFNYEAVPKLLATIERYRKAERALAEANAAWAAAQAEVDALKLAEPGESPLQFLQRLFVTVEVREVPKASPA